MKNIITSYRKFYENMIGEDTQDDIPYEVGSIIKRTPQFRGNPDYYELVAYVGKEDRKLSKGDTTYTLFMYEAYPLKSNLSEVKGGKTTIKLIDPKYNGNRAITNYTNSVLKSPDGNLVSASELKSDDRRKTDEPMEWNTAISGKKPLFLYSKEEYKKEVTPILKQYIKFISDNDKYFLTDYGKIKGYTLSELNQDSFMYRFHKDKISEAPSEILKKKHQLESEIEVLLGADVNSITKDDVNSNKWLVKNALEKNLYANLLKKQYINIKNVEQIFNDVKLKVPQTLYKIETNVKEHGIDIKVEQSMQEQKDNLYNTLKSMFNEYHEKTVNRYYSYYHKYIEKYSEFYKTYTGDKKIENIKWYFTIFCTGKPPIVEKKINKYNREVVKNKYSMETDVLFTSRMLLDLLTTEFKPKTTWEADLMQASINYADEQFKFYTDKLCSYFEQINKKELPKVESGNLLTFNEKGFDAYLTFKYDNGFTFNIETNMIWAGGYNIQVEHTRGLFKYFYNEKGVSEKQLIELYQKTQ